MLDKRYLELGNRLPYPTKKVDNMEEFIIPDKDRLEVLNLLGGFHDHFESLDEVRYDMHEQKTFRVGDYRVFWLYNMNYLTSPYYLNSGGTIIDWDDVEPEEYEMLDFPTETRTIDNEVFLEYIVPDEKKLALFDEIWGEEIKSLSEKRYDPIRKKFFKIQEARVFRIYGENVIVSPYYQESACTMYEWIPPDMMYLINKRVKKTAPGEVPLKTNSNV